MKEVYGKRERFIINSSLLILQETMAELVNTLTTRSDKHLASPNGLFFYVSGMINCNVRDFKWGCTRGGGVGEEGERFCPKGTVESKKFS